jgi:hypothetical protein
MKTEFLKSKIKGEIGFLRGKKETWGGKRNLQSIKPYGINIKGS